MFMRKKGTRPMEKKIANLGAAAAGTGKAAAGFFNKAKNTVVNAMDQNGDGELSLEDVSVLTGAVKAAVKESGEKWAYKQSQLKKEKELKALRPLFESDVDTPDFSLPKLLRVANMDEKHAESELCQDSIGYIFTGKDLDVMTIYPNKIGDFDLKFDPDMESEVYYVDPADRDHYIALDTYYNHLRIARIGELQVIAQTLGARHFKVTYKEQQETSDTKDAKVKAKAKGPGKMGGAADAEHHGSENSFSKIEIAAEMQFIGHEPKEPVLKYFRKDPQIQSLIFLRMSDNPMTHQVYTLKLFESSGIKEKDAGKIDAALSAMKFDGGFSVSSEVRREQRSFFEYEIDF